ncbi:hypothetical protein NWP96_01985 [Mycoplasmopsis cynos]|nr:hypothetical protein [Mycoplasmopsis cynos]
MLFFQDLINQDNKYLKEVESWSKQAYRVIAVAYKEVESSKTSLTLEDEKDLTFLGILGMIDPARSGVKESIFEAKECWN